MTYFVRVEPWADADLEEAYLWARKRAFLTAARWLGRFHAALQTLSSNPERFALAPEHKKLKLDVRQLLFGK